MSESKSSDTTVDPPFSLVSTKISLKELAKIYGNNDGQDREGLRVELIEDALEPLMNRETRLLSPWEDYQTPQRKRREAVVHYLCAVCLKFGFTRTTASLGVYIYNYFQNCHTIVSHQIHSVALTCLFIAAKIHQTDVSLMSMRRLAKTIPSDMSFSVKLFLEVEVVILEYFKFDLLMPTVNDFVDTYYVIAVEDCDVLCAELYRELNGIWPLDGTQTLAAMANDSNLLAAAVRRSMRLLTTQMSSVMVLLLDQEPSNEFPPSLIAAGILCVTRLANKYQRWCGFLERVTRYPHEDVVRCINKYILTSQEVRDYLSIGRARVIKSDMLETDEFIMEYIFKANVYPKHIMIAGKVVDSGVKYKTEDLSPNCSSSDSSGCGQSTGVVEDSSSSILNDSPMSTSN